MAQNQVTYTIDIDGEQRVLKTLNDLAKAGRDTRKAIGGKEFNDPALRGLRNTQTQVKQLEQQLKGGLQPAIQQSGAALKKITGTTNQAGVAMMNMNYVVRDSPYFFKDLQLGVLAVGNNINPLIDSFIRLKKEAKAISKETGKMTTTFGLLKKSMMGGMGLSLAMSVLVTVFQAVIFSMGSAGKKAKETKEKMEDLAGGVDNLVTSLTRLAKLRGSGVEEALKKLPELNAELSDLHKQLKKSPQDDQLVYDIIKVELAIGDLMAKLSGGGESIEDYVEMLRRMNHEIQKGEGDLLSYIEAQGISRKQLGSMRTVLENYLNTVLALNSDNVNKKLADDLINLSEKTDPAKVGLRAMAESLKMTREETESLILGLDKLLKSADNVGKKSVIKMTKDEIAEYQRGVEIKLEYYAPPPEDYLTLTPEQENALLRENSAIKERIILREQERGLIKRMRELERAQAKELAKEMRMVTMVVNQLGDTIVNAMMTGEFAVDRFIRAVLAAIAKMIILQIITKALFAVNPALGAGFSAVTSAAGTSGVPSGWRGMKKVGIPSPSSMGKGGVSPMPPIEVVGKISVDKNKFVADINSARDSYNNNKRFISIGR